MKTRISIIIFASLLLAAACGNEQPASSLTEAETAAYRQKGQEIAQATFNALSSRLKAALREGGVSNAVGYCQLVAYPLVDSLSEVYQAEIRRTSTRVRNPQDEPSLTELLVLSQYHAQVKAGETPEPVIATLDEQTVAFYAPINVQALCLNCHGKVGETLMEADYALIQELYPNDEAVGYELGDLRGMWSITFQKEP